MANCSGNCGGCGGCGGCANELSLGPWEAEMLFALGQYSFLPVARKAGDMTPVYLEETRRTPEQYSLVLQCLEAKGLITLDYSAPLPGADMSAYAAFPLHGSMALTGRGYQVLELLETQGYQTES